MRSRGARVTRWALAAGRTVGVCYPDTLADDALARDIRPLVDIDDLGRLVVVLAGYHRDLLHH